MTKRPKYQKTEYQKAKRPKHPNTKISKDQRPKGQIPKDQAQKIKDVPIIPAFLCIGPAECAERLSKQINKNIKQ